MPKRKRIRRVTSKKSRVQRDNQYYAKTRKSLLDSPAYKRAKKRRFHDPISGRLLHDHLEDKRRWRPERSAPVHREFSGIEALIKETPGRIYKRGLRWQAFVHPNKTIVCAKRAYRRAVLFTKGKVGQGKSINQFKDRVMRQDSKISCRRR